MNRCSYVCENILIHRRAIQESREAEQACRSERNAGGAVCRKIERERRR
jgi:hypothetical protein